MSGRGRSDVGGRGTPRGYWRVVIRVGSEVHGLWSRGVGGGGCEAGIGCKVGGV